MKGVIRVFRVSLATEASQRLDRLIEARVFATYSEALRRAIELLLEKYPQTTP